MFRDGVFVEGHRSVKIRTCQTGIFCAGIIRVLFHIYIYIFHGIILPLIFSKELCHFGGFIIFQKLLKFKKYHTRPVSPPMPD